MQPSRRKFLQDSSVFAATSLAAHHGARAVGHAVAADTDVAIAAGSVTVVVLSEGIQDDLLVVRSLSAVTEDGQEHGEVDGSRSFFHHRFQFFFRTQSSCG